MGQFANTLFRALLGWVQTAAAWLWALITDADAGQWLVWLGENWLTLVILLCLAGMAADFLVYLLRWQPYRVWRSFLNRLHRREQSPDEAAAEQPVFQRRWIHADGSTTVEEVRAFPRGAEEGEQSLDAPLRPARRVARRASLEQAYHEPVYPPQWQHNTQENQGENE